LFDFVYSYHLPAEKLDGLVTSKKVNIFEGFFKVLSAKAFCRAVGVRATIIQEKAIKENH